MRGPHGEAEIWVKEGARPVHRPMFHMKGEREEALRMMIQDAIDKGKVEPGVSSWNTPSFLVPKKEPGKFRLVQDFRPLNEVTAKDAHPLPRIIDILHQQAKCQM